jgi:hypothetical protein
MKFISTNYLGAIGAATLGEDVAKIFNLTSLNLDFS